MVEKVTRSLDTMSDEAQKLNDLMKFFAVERSESGKNQHRQQVEAGLRPAGTQLRIYKAKTG